MDDAATPRDMSPPFADTPSAHPQPMIALPLLMPRIGSAMRAALVHRIGVAPGERIRTGGLLMEVRVDLSDGTVQDCPPISYYRLIARESGTARSVPVAVGDLIAVGGALAWIAVDRPAPVSVMRSFRSSVVGIQVDTVFGR